MTLFAFFAVEAQTVSTFSATVLSRALAPARAVTSDPPRCTLPKWRKILLIKTLLKQKRIKPNSELIRKDGLWIPLLRWSRSGEPTDMTGWWEIQENRLDVSTRQANGMVEGPAGRTGWQNWTLVGLAGDPD